MHDYNDEETLELIKADFDFHLYPSQFTLAQLAQSEAWLRDAALAYLAEGGFHLNPALDTWLDGKSWSEE